MQTFLTSALGLTNEGFAESAKSLDLKRLNSQVKENYQLFCANVSYESQKKQKLEFTEQATTISSRISAMSQMKPTLVLDKDTGKKLLAQKGWQHHPATRMWRLNPAEHLSYSYRCAKELYANKYRQQSFVSHFLLYHFADISYKDVKVGDRIAELESVLEKIVSWDEILPEVLAIMEKFPVEHQQVHWSNLYPKVMDSHRGNLYLKSPLLYGMWYDYKHIPYSYPAAYSGTGYFWPV